jgi:hypothetical protein
MIIPRPQFELLEVSGWSAPRFRLTADYNITLDDGLVITHPKGFETDLASIPRFMWALPFFSPTGPLANGSVVHDFGYQHGFLISPYDKHRTYPESSLRLRELYQENFGDNIPVFVGRNQEFFDQLLQGITIEATGNRFVAGAAKLALSIFGGIAWNEYRTCGPGAHNSNSLDLPGITKNGEAF